MEDSVCTICLDPCETRVCRCAFMHQACLIKYRAYFGDRCRTCRQGLGGNAMIITHRWCKQVAYPLVCTFVESGLASDLSVFRVMQLLRTRPYLRHELRSRTSTGMVPTDATTLDEMDRALRQNRISFFVMEQEIEVAYRRAVEERARDRRRLVARL